MSRSILARGPRSAEPPKPVSELPGKRTVYSTDKPTKAAEKTETDSAKQKTTADPADQKPGLPADETDAKSGGEESGPEIPGAEKSPAPEGGQQKEAVRRLPLVRVVSGKSA